MVQSPSGEHKGTVTEPVCKEVTVAGLKRQHHRILKSGLKAFVMVYTLNPRVQEAETRGAEFRISLDCVVSSKIISVVPSKHWAFNQGL